MNAECETRRARWSGRLPPRFFHSTRRRVVHSAFTLLEVMLAVAILALIGTTIYRFTETTLQVTRVTARNAETGAACAGLTHLLQAQLDSLPASGNFTGALTGGSHKDGEGQRDELTLVCDAPAAVLSRGVDRPWRVGLSLRPGPAAGRNTLVLSRLGPAEDPSENNLAPAGLSLTPGSLGNAETSTPLIEDVQSLEITYFNKQLNGWLPKWNDPNSLPDLLRVRLGFADGRAPFEAVLRVPPRSRQTAVLPVAAAPGTLAPPGTNPTPLPLRPLQRPGGSTR